ncbi:predicted protein [Sparassis crispa]|uniref:Uncharacterized protein n=1 Tax=Sparassis crispa TaxID=139825 RepID=A0A401GEK2_9APHY|nr:predicted protein [Sparassis crispa]GBE80612.1 predicted protein [Sparassis crispa]
MPRPPEYIRMLKIGFDALSSHGDEQEGDHSHMVRIICNPYVQVGGEHVAAPIGMHPSVIEVMPPSNYGLFLQEYRRTFSHPVFPCRTAPWYDDNRGLPHLKMSNPVEVDQRELVRIYPAVRLPIIFTAPVGHAKPSAISISCGGVACMEQHQPFVPFDDIIPLPPRYYPMKRVVQSGIDPDTEGWRLEGLVGLWLGMHGQQGTECLFVSWHTDEEELRAWKITGDINVPRGVCSWILRTHVGVTSRHPALLETWNRLNLSVARVYVGTGIISERGFAKPTSVDLIIGVTGADEIKIWWDQVNDIRTYIRYVGRDL